VQHQVDIPSLLVETLGVVIDHPAGTQAPHERNIPRGCGREDSEVSPVRQLYCERSHSSGSAVNQHALAGDEMAMLEKCLPGGEGAWRGVRAEGGSDAAWVCVMLCGFLARLTARTATNSAAAPLRGKSARPYTSSPGRKSSTSGATRSTTPETSCPGMLGIRGVPSAC